MDRLSQKLAERIVALCRDVTPHRALREKAEVDRRRSGEYLDEILNLIAAGRKSRAKFLRPRAPFRENFLRTGRRGEDKCDAPIGGQIKHRQEHVLVRLVLYGYLENLTHLKTGFQLVRIA